MAGSSGEVSVVPPGFRFHPTEEELLYYYLRKKVSYQPIHDLDVITEVDLNKLEPWDLKDKCRIGSGPQNDWYFFSHKDKKYPSGTRTNRATAAGFWKATGRDKAIHHSTNSNRIGMRKTLVFYTGRAPRGHKTDWIMHEYRLMDDQDYASHHELQEDGWVICRVFRKKNQTRGFQFHLDSNQEQHFIKIMPSNSTIANGDSDSYTTLQPKQYSTCDHEARYNHNSTSIIHHLPQLHSRPESTVPIPLILSSSHELLPIPLMSTTIQQEEKYCSTGDWSFLEKLLAMRHESCMDIHNIGTTKCNLQQFPFSGYHGFQPDFSKYSK